MTWAIIIGIAVMIVILAILFPTLFRAASPVQNFQENCANYGGVLLNASEECNSKVSMQSTIVQTKKDYICCVKKPSVPQEYFDKWKAGEDVEVLDSSLNYNSQDSSQEDSSSDTSSDSTSSSDASSTSDSSTTKYDPGALLNNSSQPLLVGSITGHFYSRQRNNEHFCFLGVQAHTNPDQEPFALQDVTVDLAWGQNQAGCVYEENIHKQNSLNLTEMKTYSAPDNDYKVPCPTFSLGSDELGLHLDNVENSLPVYCDTFIIGSQEDIIESFFFSGATTCDLFSIQSCLDYSQRPEKNMWFSLNCHVVDPFIGSPRCTSCSTVSSCQDYDTKGSCDSNQCLINNFAYEDTDCFWVPKKASKPEGRGDCYTCKACSGYESEEICIGSNEYCDVNCFWNSAGVCETA